MNDLPSAVQTNPECGACRADTRLDGDRFVCEDCRLQFDPDTMNAAYLDSLESACGHPCDNWWHGPGRINRGESFHCRPCTLPAGHTSMHWHDCMKVDIADGVSADV
ncbi:hypothetical protein [Gordonia aichiensis]|uniref:hypothetical protein n=1 Tax=Gordonia aichiensis TaxID=36820 RepID=UPI003267E220